MAGDDAQRSMMNSDDDWTGQCYSILRAIALKVTTKKSPIPVPCVLLCIELGAQCVSPANIPYRCFASASLSIGSTIFGLLFCFVSHFTFRRLPWHCTSCTETITMQEYDTDSRSVLATRVLLTNLLSDACIVGARWWRRRRRTDST